MRSRPLLFLSLAFLASAAILGGVMVYDGAFEDLTQLQPGDRARVQADLVGLGQFGEHFHYNLQVDGQHVLGISTAEIPDGTWVLDAIVLEPTHGTLTLQLESWREPVLEA